MCVCAAYANEAKQQKTEQSSQSVSKESQSGVVKRDIFCLCLRMFFFTFCVPREELFGIILIFLLFFI